MRLLTKEAEDSRLFFSDKDLDHPIAKFHYKTRQLFNEDETICLKISPDCMTMPKVVEQMTKISERLNEVLDHKDK